MAVKCFFIFKNGFTQRFLRRYCGGTECSQSGYGYHNAENYLDRGLIGEPSSTVKEDIDHSHPMWPKQCACGYVFKEDDVWQLNVEPEYARQDDASIVYTLRKAPPGAMWHADWMLREGRNDYRGPDDHCLVVRLPNKHDWMIDSRASNCTMPDDDVHKCWCRHGEPPNITVDKNGNTCAAGAGSIGSGKENEPGYYHGFLQNGELT